MRTQISVDGWHPQNLIRQINERTDLDFNEQLERQYEDLNAIDKYVVDHANEFRRGIALEEIDEISSYKPTGIAKKLRATCTCERMTKKQYLENICHDQHWVPNNRVRVYKLKPQEQIPDLWAIIEYKEHQEASLEENRRISSEEEDDDKPVWMKVE